MKIKKEVYQLQRLWGEFGTREGEQPPEKSPQLVAAVPGGGTETENDDSAALLSESLS